jgi:hypothetical protein
VLRCSECGEDFIAAMPVAFTCSDRCRQIRHRRLVGLNTQGRPQPRACSECGQPFNPARSDAQFCSGKCRIAAHRAKTASSQ